MFDFDGILNGFYLAMTLQNLGFAFLGCLLGTLVGILPGVGPLATVSMLLSMTLFLEPLTALVMLAGIYYGAQYGGSTTAILCNLPGEASSVVTTIDGHKMALKGRAGAALTVAALASLFAGIVGTLIIASFAPLLANVALRFNAPEYFLLMLLGLLSTVIFSGYKMVAALSMAVLGMLLGSIGTDIETAQARLTFGSVNLMDGLDIVALSMGLFGLSEIIVNLIGKTDQKQTTNAVGTLRLTRTEAKRAVPAVLRGTALGSFLGLLPGGGTIIASFAAYVVEKKVSRYGHELGEGAIEGVAAPEAANNSAAQTSFIPLLTLGIPTSSTLALLLGAMIMQGIQPGPTVITTRPDLFWGLIASMFIGNVMLVIINLPLVGIWVKMLEIPYGILFPGILAMCCIGAYSISMSPWDLYMLTTFALVGVLLHLLDLPPVPLLLGFLLGPLAEENFRRALAISNGDLLVFIERPISAVILLVTMMIVITPLLPRFRKNRAVFKEE